MRFLRNSPHYTPSLDITPLIDVVFLLLIFLLLTMTFAKSKSDVKEAIIDIELAQSSTTQTLPPPESVTLLIDESGAIYRSDAPVPGSHDDIRIYLAEQMLLHSDLLVNIKADRRASHGQVIEALDLVKSLGITHVQLVIEHAP